jgi:hypothetical protein
LDGEGDINLHHLWIFGMVAQFALRQSQKKGIAKERAFSVQIFKAFLRSHALFYLLRGRSIGLQQPHQAQMIS